MKSKLLATVLLTLSFTQLFSQADLVVFSEDGHRFWLVLNGIRQNQEAETNVKVTNLNGEWFKGKILFEDETLGQIDKNIGIQAGTEATYRIKRDKKGNLVLKFFTQAPIATAPPPPANVKVITYRTTAAPPPTQVRVTETRETIHMLSLIHI